jgi:hypothetical protein
MFGHVLSPLATERYAMAGGADGSSRSQAAPALHRTRVQLVRSYINDRDGFGDLLASAWSQRTATLRDLT